MQRGTEIKILLYTTRAMPFEYLKILVARICRLWLRIEIDLFLSNKHQKEECLSFHEGWLFCYSEFCPIYFYKWAISGVLSEKKKNSLVWWTIQLQTIKGLMDFVWYNNGSVKPNLSKVGEK